MFNNLRLKELKKPYVFPPDVDFDAPVTLDVNDPIDRSIIKEKDFQSKNGKLPDYMNPVEEEPARGKQGSISDILAKSGGLHSTDAGGCTANVGLIKGGKI